ncbi:MAG TPA: S-layer homology domain-containing protein [bacterium]|nr:S-layer homology domain-containing protein [bacterium]
MRFSVISAIVATLATAVLAVCAPVSSAAWAEDPFTLDFLENEKTSPNLKPLWQVAPVAASAPGAFDDVPRDHWAYQAVEYLIDIGLMDGQADGYFRGDRPVTRYELSVIIAKLVSNYNRYVAEGKFTTIPAASPAAIAPDARGALITPSAGAMIVEAPAQPSTAPAVPVSAQPRPPKTGEIVWRDPRGEQPDVRFQRRGPAEMQIILEKAAPAQTPVETPAAPAATPQQAETPKPEPEKKPVKPPKQFENLAKSVELTEKDVDILKALIDYVEKDVVKEFEKNIKKDIADVRKQVLTNKREIDRLKDDQQRFKVTGSASAGYSSRHVTDVSDDGDDDHDSYALSSKGLTLDLYSKPRKNDDMTLRSKLTSASDGFLIQYQNLTSSSQRNFSLRNFSAGEVAFGAWFLTGMGVKYDGISMEFSLNDYSIKSNFGKIRETSFSKNYIKTGASQGVTLSQWQTDSYFNREYIQAHSLQTSIFGNPGSLLLFTRIATWEDYHNDITPSWYGNWYQTNKDIGGDLEVGDHKFFKPPMKNSVNSIFLRYPLSFVPGLQVTAEYGHSTYKKDGYKLAFSPITGSDFLLENKYKTWLELPSQTAQDDAYYLLFDYAKGPVQIFPLGYMRLGEKFVSRYFGLPGFDMSSFGIDILPINLQSLEVYLARGTFKKPEKKFQNDILYVTGGEWKPMYFDTGAVVDNGDMAILVNFNLFERLNNRDPDALLKLSYFDNKLTYYLTDKITLSGKYSIVKAGLGPTCIDGNITELLDDQGNKVDIFIGNGITDCDPDSPTYDSKDLFIMLRFGMKTQEYEMSWRTSKKSDLTYIFGFDDIRLNVITNADEVNTTIAGLVPQGRKYKSNFSYRYRLTDISRVDLWYRTTYPRNNTIQLKQPEQDRVMETGINVTMSF